MTKCGILFCGGCNPKIDRDKLVRCIKVRLKEFEFNPYALDNPIDVDIILVINGCETGCIKVDNLVVNKLLVNGSSVNYIPVSKENLCVVVCNELNKMA